jgi:superfamily II DNA or RNA helicase
MDIIKKSGLLISKEHEGEIFYQKIIEELTRRSRAYQTSNYIVNEFFLESEKFLLIPRMFPIDKYQFCKINNYQVEGDTIDISHNIKPRSETQKLSIQHMMDNDSAILQLLPGVGKTVISIYMIAERKKKSLILVHRDSLGDQWRDRFLQFTNLNKDDIARVSSTTFKEALQKPIVISTVQTFISLLKRNRKEFLYALNNANIGVFIADEVHTSVGAPTFSECSIHIPAKYTYGLSATPYRYDGNADIIEYHLGKIFSDDDITGTMAAKVTVLLVDYQIDTPARWKYIHWGGEFQRSRYLNLIKKSKPFLLAIKGLLKRLKTDRDMIVMLERIKLIEELYNWLDHKSKSKFCGSAKLDALESQITFTTPGKCRDGIDAPQKDCLIMSSPISNIEQLTGRVIRTKEGKQTPIVIDMVDYGCTYISNTFRNRNEYYKKKKWQVNYILLKNNILYNIDEHKAFNIIRGE